MQTLNAFIGRENVHRIEFIEDEAPVTEGAVQRAIIKFGPYILDTDEAAHQIEFIADNLGVDVKVGKIPSIARGSYVALLTLYDVGSPNGIAWASFNIKVDSWPING